MIYFIQDSLTFRIKIGFTGKDDATERLRELQTGSSSLLYLLATREGTKRTEGELHAQFQQYACQGEWFSPGPELLQYVIGCSAVEMARAAVSQATADLVARSFPQTMEEIARREAEEVLAFLRGHGIHFRADGDDIKTWPSNRLNQVDTERIRRVAPQVLAILQRESDEGRAEEEPPPPSASDQWLKSLWTEVKTRLPPLMVSQLEKAGSPTMPALNTLLLTFPGDFDGEREYASEPTRRERIEAVLCSITSERWTVQIAAPVPRIVEGQCVRHERYGVGRVMEVGGNGPLRKARVLFQKGGERTFLLISGELTVVPAPSMEPSNDPR